ncbi:GMC family oxidoreductase [Microvirga lotononidis]|uniref:Choline dehydrogenase-like flavoprotein n=1 Tax=Microvirga lotononidis TaxID=864069 RepID=I4YWP5_9HYPH|nr:GMC family oxidoreductase N-terminal domain-containing protein [Microvirga lotononidis]EIM28387.1 choline dehydrogenase-like flavoprotein [Microvirga lotononidis]WQO27529.1 GMC family oxidoreductase N-terminal domain-containing protein [Microvirga lotononidis]
MASKRFDYIVVGGGSAGCIVASRLVAEHGARVLLIEAGPRRTSRILAMPAGYMKFLAQETYLTMHKVVPQPQLGGRAPIVPQARVLGGGSAVNAMVYIRGQAKDYDAWDAALGGAGWSYRDLLPYFIKQEGNDHLGKPYHGTDGPLKVSHLGQHSAMSRAFVQAMQEKGVPYNSDFNGIGQAGVGFMQHTIDWRTRRRCSAVDAFLQPVLSNPRLTLATNTVVTRICIENGRATGVEVKGQSGRELLHADTEVVLAAGTYMSPKLLMLSGIGPASELSRHDIAVKVDLPGVGWNLQDHHEVPVVATTTGAFGYFGQDRGLAMLRHGLQYRLFKSGAVTTTGVEACTFIDPDGGERPTIQLYCVPTVYLDRDVSGVEPTHGVTLNPCLLRPKARGSVRLASADPFDAPQVDPQFFGDPDDLRLTLAGLRYAREVLATSPVRDMVAKEIFPGPDASSDEALAAHCRKTVKTNYHPVGTCRMGRENDEHAVVTPDLRTRGIASLRIVDASIMPTIPSGNTNAPVLAIADKAVDIIIGSAQRTDMRQSALARQPVSPAHQVSPP